MDVQTIIAAVSAGIATVSAGITIALYRATRRSSVRPILVFVRRDDDKWHLENVGNGPALNLLVVDGHRIDGWAKTTNCDALAVGGALCLSWLVVASKLGASYDDVDGNPYHTICQHYRNEVGSGALQDIPEASQHRFLAERGAASLP